MGKILKSSLSSPSVPPSSVSPPFSFQFELYGLFAFEGRAGRLRYLLTLVVIYLWFLGMAVVFSYGLMAYATWTEPLETTVVVIFNYLLFVNAIRRLHDLDFSGWWSLLLPFPYVGRLLVLLLITLPGTPEQNRFGHALDSDHEPCELPPLHLTESGDPRDDPRA